MDETTRRVQREAADWLILLREEPSDRLVRQRFDRWLDADAANVRAWAMVSEVFERIGDVPASAWADFEPRALPDVPERPVAIRPSRRRWGQRLAARGSRPGLIAAGIAALCLAMIATPSLRLHLEADAITGAGEVRAMHLADGSNLVLGPESAVAFVNSGGGRAVRLLAGRAWFNVHHDAARPFRVIAGDVVATDIGTAFEVRTTDGVTGVAVGQGRVRVVDTGTRPAFARELGAGQWLGISADHGISSGNEMPDAIGAWRAGGIVVRNRSVAETIDELRPWYAGRIILMDAAFGRQRIDGVYDARDAAGALAALVRARGGKVVRITPWLLIVYGR